MEYSMDSGKAILSRTPGELDVMLRGLPDAWTMKSDSPGSWSPYQVVGHMTYLEGADWLDRVRVILESDRSSAFRPIDREAGFSLFDGWAMEALLDQFALTRSKNLIQLEALVSKDDLSRQGRHPEFGSVTLSQLLATWVTHDLNHVGQIVKTMANSIELQLVRGVSFSRSLTRTDASDPIRRGEPRDLPPVIGGSFEAQPCVPSPAILNFRQSADGLH
jgi:hypothetical protein